MSHSVSKHLGAQGREEPSGTGAVRAAPGAGPRCRGSHPARPPRDVPHGTLGARCRSVAGAPSRRPGGCSVPASRRDTPCDTCPTCCGERTPNRNPVLIIARYRVTWLGKQESTFARNGMGVRRRGAGFLHVFTLWPHANVGDIHFSFFTIRKERGAPALTTAQPGPAAPEAPQGSLEPVRSPALWAALT